MLRLLLFVLLLWAATAKGQDSLNLPAGRISAGLVAQTRVGPLPGAVLYAPRPVVAPTALRLAGGGHALFAIDIGVVSGIPYSVRVLRSTGSRELDDVIARTLEQWRFQPRSIYKAIVPVDIVHRH